MKLSIKEEIYKIKDLKSLELYDFFCKLSESRKDEYTEYLLKNINILPSLLSLKKNILLSESFSRNYSIHKHEYLNFFKNIKNQFGQYKNNFIPLFYNIDFIKDVIEDKYVDFFDKEKILLTLWQNFLLDFRDRTIRENEISVLLSYIKKNHNDLYVLKLSMLSNIKDEKLFFLINFEKNKNINKEFDLAVKNFFEDNIQLVIDKGLINCLINYFDKHSFSKTKLEQILEGVYLNDFKSYEEVLKFSKKLSSQNPNIILKNEGKIRHFDIRHKDINNLQKVLSSIIEKEPQENSVIMNRFVTMIIRIPIPIANDRVEIINNILQMLTNNYFEEKEKYKYIDIFNNIEMDYLKTSNFNIKIIERIIDLNFHFYPSKNSQFINDLKAYEKINPNINKLISYIEKKEINKVVLNKNPSLIKNKRL